jgi:hypothetical protein
MVNIYVEILSKHHKIIKISTKTTLLNTLLNVFKINNDNYKEYDTLLTNLTKNIYPDQLLEFYKKTIHYMSIARVWN